tara:strand:+ start:89 stop:1366 length:1278 start_codon:yes stop_codon:yes gene_type:complete
MKNKLYNFTYTSFLKSKIYHPKNIKELKKYIEEKHTIVGNRRSYGDSFVGKKKIISLSKFDKILNIDRKNKIAEIEGGAALFKLIKHTLPKNLLLTCMPGCKYVSIGGMIANNVTGKLIKKNSIKNFVKSITIIDRNNKVIDCSRFKNKELFNLTIGGKGRTGPIISAKLNLEKINSNKVFQKTLHFKNYKEFFLKLKKLKNYKYAVCWLDFTKKNFEGIIFVGFHFGKKNKIKYTFNDYKLPAFLVNIISLFATSKFFTIFFNKVFKLKYTLSRNKITDINSFYFPQNKLLNWNDFFKDKGFIQFNFFFKKKNIIEIVETLKKKLFSENIHSNFAVIKFHDNNDKNPENLSLSLDFPLKDNFKNIQKIVNYTVNRFDIDVNLSKDIILKKINKKTLNSNPVFNPKMKKYFIKNYISNLFDRIKV